MDEIYEGKWCGHCHNGKLLTARGLPVFAPREDSLEQCVLCHNVKTWGKSDATTPWTPPAGVMPAQGRIVENEAEE